MIPVFVPDQIDAHRLLVEVSAGRSTANYVHDQEIYHQGDDADLVYFVQDGSVKLVATSARGLETLVGVAQTGQFFGETCFHDVPVRAASATAIGNCRITSVTKEAMLATIHGQPRFAKMFIDYLSDHNSWVRKHLFDHLLEPTKAA